MASIAAVSLLGAAVAGPTTAQDAPAELAPVSLTFWDEAPNDPYNATTKEIISRFEEMYPGVTIEHRSIENEQFFTALRTGFASGEPPDIFQHEANNSVFQFVIPGEVEDITDWFNESGAADRVLPGTAQAVTYDGRVYGIPTTIATGSQIYYNAKLLDELGIDPDALETWDDYLAAFEAAKEAGKIPIAFGNKFGWPGSQWFYALLGRWVGAEKVNQLVARNCGYAWTDPDIVEAAQLYIDLADSGYFSTGMASDDYPQATAAFFAGLAPFFHTGSWFVAETLGGAPPDFELGINKLPPIEGGGGSVDDNVVAVLGGISISRQAAEDPDKLAAALAFLDFWSQPETAAYWVSQVGDINTVAGAVNDETANEYILQLIAEQVETSTGSIGYLEHVTPDQVGYDAIWNGGVGVLTGQLDAQGWMEEIEAAAAANEPTVQLEEVCE